MSGLFRLQLFASPSVHGEDGRCDEDNGYEFLAETHV